MKKNEKLNVTGAKTPLCCSRTNINNYKEPYYAVVLEDGPTDKYTSSSAIKYIAPEDIHTFYKVLPELAKYYKVTIRVCENPNPLPF